MKVAFAARERPPPVQERAHEAALALFERAQALQNRSTLSGILAITRKHWAPAPGVALPGTC